MLDGPCAAGTGVLDGTCGPPHARIRDSRPFFARRAPRAVLVRACAAEWGGLVGACAAGGVDWKTS